MNNDIKTELLKSQKTASFPQLIHITNEDYGDFYFCNYYKDVSYNGNLYLSRCFTINPPEKTSKEIGNATLNFSIINNNFVEMIRNTSKPSYISFIGMIVYNDDKIEPIEENRFILRNATWNDSSLTWNMVFDERMDILIPCDIMNSLTCAGCV